MSRCPRNFPYKQRNTKNGNAIWSHLPIWWLPFRHRQLNSGIHRSKNRLREASIWTNLLPPSYRPLLRWPSYGGLLWYGSLSHFFHISPLFPLLFSLPHFYYDNNMNRTKLYFYFKTNNGAFLFQTRVLIFMGNWLNIIGLQKVLSYE